MSHDETPKGRLFRVREVNGDGHSIDPIDEDDPARRVETVESRQIGEVRYIRMIGDARFPGAPIPEWLKEVDARQRRVVDLMRAGLDSQDAPAAGTPEARAANQPNAAAPREKLVLPDGFRPGMVVRTQLQADKVVSVAPMHEASRPPAVQPEPQPPTVAILGPDGQRLVVRGPLDMARRLPSLETWAEGYNGLRPKVWAINCQTVPVSAVTQEGHVFLNMAARTWRCPMLRLAVFHHELRHLERGDRAAYDQAAEADCEAVAEESIVSLCGTVDARQPPMGTPTDPTICQRCYREGATVCRQGEATQARVMDALERFTR